MKIEIDDFLDVPADRVYPLVRDAMTTELLPYLPDIEEVKQLSYERQSDTRVHVVNRWQAKPQIPSMAQKFISPDVFAWTDTALWKDDAYEVEYRIEGFGYEGNGLNSFKPDGDRTHVRISVELTIRSDEFGIPRMLFNRVFPLVEDTIRKALEPNFGSLIEALRKYFRDHGK